MVDKFKVACFSGHRKLPEDCTELRTNLENAIAKKRKTIAVCEECHCKIHHP